jgi:diguanylate cyclase (GGDEF)-like protein
MIPSASAASTAGAGMSLRRWRIVYVIAVAIVAAIGFSLGRRGHPATGVVAGALAVAAIGYGAARLRPHRAAAWGMLAIAIVVLAVGETFAGLSHTFGERFPDATDVASLIDYAPLAVAGLWIGHPRTPRRYVSTALDAIVLSLAAALLAWITLINPTLARLHLNAVGRDLVLLDWATDIATLAVAILLILTWRANRSALLLGAGIIAVLGSDVAQSIALLHGNTRATSIDVGFLLFCALAGLSALDLSMTRITSVGTAPERLTVWHFLALAVALLIPPVVLLAETSNGPGHGNGAAIATVGAIVGLVMLVRVAVGVGALRERVNRDFAMHEAASLLGAVQTTDEVAAVLGSTARSILPAGNTTVGLFPPDAALSEPVEIRETIGGAGFLRVPVAVVDGEADGTGHPIGEVRFGGPAARLFMLRPELMTLANQAGTALGRIDLGVAVRQHERENYFRTLVQNSADVILICRDGTVDYATPAATELFAGDTVVGSKFDDLITMPDPDAMSDSDASEATVDGPDGTRRVRVRRQDLTDDPTIHGIVLTLHDITEQRRLHDDLVYQATHDPLTGLANRQLVRDQLRADANVAPSPTNGAALFIDLDNLKEANDALGHSAGDELLQVAANRIRGCLRHHDVAARLGGDEFAVLLRNPHSVADAEAVAECIVTTFRTPVHIRRATIECTVSVGLAEATTSGEYATLMRRADVAVYVAKAAGKNTWRRYRDDPAGASDAQLARLSQANDQIEMRHQPTADPTARPQSQTTRGDQ